MRKVCPKNISQNLLNLEMSFHVLNLLAVSLDIPNLFQPKSRGATGAALVPAQAKATITRQRTPLPPPPRSNLQKV